MHVYNVTCRIPEFIEGFLFKDVISSEEIHNFIVQRDKPITTDIDAQEVYKLAEDKFGGKRKIDGGWASYEWEPPVQVINISYLGQH